MSAALPPRRAQAQASGRVNKASPRGGGSGLPAAMDPEVLLRILCHRADHAASKYLKKARGVCECAAPTAVGWGPALQHGVCRHLWAEAPTHPAVPSIHPSPPGHPQDFKIPKKLPGPSLTEAASRAGGLLRRSKT